MFFRLSYPVLRLILATIVVWGIVLAFHFSPGTGFTSLIRFGEKCTLPRIPELAGVFYYVKPNHEGYDGQFYAQVAVKPVPGDQALQAALDLPLYRMRRILMCWVAWLVGFGSPWWVLQIYALINPLCWFAFAALMLRWFREESWKGFAGWLACVWSMGACESIRAALPDLPAVFLMVLALTFVEVGLGWSGSVLLALAGMTRETIVLSAAMFRPPRLDVHNILRAASLCVVTVLPIVLWSVYLMAVLPGGKSGLHNFNYPFLAMGQSFIHALQNIYAGNFDAGRYYGHVLACVALLVQFVCILLWWDLKDRWWWIGLAYALLFPILSGYVWDGYWAVCRSVLPMTLAFNVLWMKRRERWSLLCVGNLPVLHGLFRLAF